MFLEAFEGPLDLLLYLIRRQNIDILNIPIAAITKQYMEYIALMDELELELAAEYLVMAATVINTVLQINIGTLLATSAVLTVVIGLALQETLGTLSTALSQEILVTIIVIFIVVIIIIVFIR